MQSSTMHPLVRLLLLALITLLSLLVFAFIATLLVSLLFGIPLLEQQELSTTIPAHINALKIFQMMSAIGIFIVPPLIIAKIGASGSLRKQFYLDLPSKGWMLALVPLLAWAATPVINVLSELNHLIPFPEWVHELEQNAEVTTRAFLQTESINGLLLNIFIMGILPGVGEELFFRGAIQPMLRKWTGNIHLAILLTAILFSALHMQFLGFIPRMALGMLLGYLLVWSGSLWVPVLVHFVNNTTIVILYYLMGKGIISENIEEVGTRPGEMFIWMLPGLLITTLLIFLYYRHRTRVFPGLD